VRYLVDGEPRPGGVDGAACTPSLNCAALRHKPRNRGVPRLWDMTDLAGKAVLITGGGSGIGAATATLLRARGAQVAVMGRRIDQLRAVAERIGGIAIQGDSAEPQNAESAVATVLSEYGRLDGIVGGAGSLTAGTVGELDDETWAAAFRSNVTSAFVLARAALPALVESRGSIVLVSSGGGTGAVPGLAAYISSKHAVVGLGRSLAVDYGPAGVRTNVLCPGIVRTDMSSGLTGLFTGEGVTVDDAWIKVGAHLPSRRVTEADEVAEICAFLLSDAASGVNGAVLAVDSGASAVDSTGFVGAYHNSTDN